MPRITTPSENSQLNRAIENIDKLTKRLGTAQSQIGSLTQQVKTLDSKHAPATSNSLLFVWTGSTHTLSWAAGSVKDRNAVNVPVLAGSIPGLLASTFYWLAWNKVHQQMAASIAADGLLENQNNLVICQVFTGTAGQTGTAGGGASSGASDLSGSRYKLF